MIATSTIIPFFPNGWEPSAGGFPAMTEHVAFLMKDLVLLAVSVYLLRQDLMRATIGDRTAQHEGSFAVASLGVDYGWIEPGLIVSESVVATLARVDRFWEKPPLHEARTLSSRDCLWNTFVTAGRAATFFEMLCAQVPEAVLAISRAVAENTLDVAYSLLDTLDCSRDVLANLPHKLLVLRDRTSGWADLGSPARVLETLDRNGIQQEWASEEDCVPDHQ
jgi:hypothetical protein